MNRPPASQYGFQSTPLPTGRSDPRFALLISGGQGVGFQSTPLPTGRSDHALGA